VVPRELQTQEDFSVFVNLEPIKNQMNFTLKLSNEYSMFFENRSAQFIFEQKENREIKFKVKGDNYFKLHSKTLGEVSNLKLSIIACEAGETNGRARQSTIIKVSPAKILIETEKQAYVPGSEIKYRVIISQSDDDLGRVNKAISNPSVLRNAPQSFQTATFDQQLKTLEKRVFNGSLLMKENMKALRVNIFGPGPGSIRSETKLLKKTETHSEPSGYRNDLVGLHLELSKTDVPFDEFRTSLTISFFFLKKWCLTSY